ncbi:MAG: LTA synthase family protein, partial [Muribaculaceae bacterium]|nr:LTA synthase family protein [Muribaculaceae bacterium]
AIICLLLVAGCDFLAIRGGVGKSTANIGKVYYSNNTFLNHSAVNPVFSFLYSLGKAEDFGAQFQTTTREEATDVFEQLYPTTSDSSVVKLKQPRPNVLMIILEGIGSRFISSLGGAPEVTPRLDSIIASAPVVFTQCYGNSFRTDRALVSALSGHLSYPTTSIMKMPAKSKSLPGIAGALKGAGYDTKFVYGGDINFTNMQSYLRSTGYDTLVSDADFSAAERTSNAWGVTDHIMFDYLYRDLASRNDSTPWYTTLLTLSSHEPFEVPFDKFPDNPMANAAAYTDHYLGTFIDSLKANPEIWDNTLILISADHGIYFMPEKPRWSPEYFRIPLIITGGAINMPEQLIIDNPVGQNDIAATLLATLGIPQDQFQYSRNVLDEEIAKDGAEVYYSFQNGVAMISDSGLVVIDNESDKTLLALPDSSSTSTLRNHAKALLQYLYTDLGEQ